MLSSEMRQILLQLVFLAATTTCSPWEERNIQFIGQSIINGQPVAENEHLETVAVERAGYLCSGTLIGPRVVLTAAHCLVEKSDEIPDPANYTVDFGGWDFNDNIRVVEARVHPDYVRLVVGDFGASLANDLGLLRLAEAAPLGATPIPTLPKRLEITSGDLGHNLEFVGYGIDETGDYGKKKKVEKPIEEICLSGLGCLWNLVYWAPPNTICTTNKDSGTCNGDSGGPAFITRDNQVYVAGVTSMGGDANCTTYGCSTKIDHFEAFIQEFMLAGNGIGCSGAKECRSNNCSQGVCCDSPCAGACEACNMEGSKGTCRPAPDGTPCADSNLCNGTETCAAGSCENGQQLQCNDHNPCTEDQCQADIGCVFPPAADGAPCSNDNVCDGEDACQNGICAGTSLLDCADPDPCTVDACDPKAGCTHIPVENCPADGGGCNQSGAASSGVLWIGGMLLFLAYRLLCAWSRRLRSF